MKKENTGGENLVNILCEQYKNTRPEIVLKELAGRYPGKIVFSTSFGLEDQVITDMIFSFQLPVEVFTIDTGRLFPETYKTWQRTLERYHKPIKAFYPDASLLEEMLQQKGPFSFYDSVENRKECCHIRKVIPLQRALRNKEIWVTGLRSGQSDTRKNMPLFQWEETYTLIKYNPLIQWSVDEVRQYISQHNVPYNPLHDKGFPSIGCQPCTRAVKEGEDIRSGRWWWENNSSKECGLHHIKS